MSPSTSKLDMKVTVFLYHFKNKENKKQIETINMKKLGLFIFISLICSMAAMAQSKRIVVLEPIDKEQNIPYSIVMMVRSDLTKVISSISGYEGYDCVNMAEIMDEYVFDSLVEEERIRHIGEITKADYLLVSEIVKYDEKSVFITAKIVDVKTAVTEGSENALMGMTPQNLQHGCESLVKKLLILTNRFNNIVQKRNNDVGEIISFADGTKGMVFYLDEKGQGLAVSLSEGEEVWDNNFRIKDIDSLLNVENGEGSFNYGEGQRNTQVILSSLGNKARAAYWCSLQGEGWYLPSCGELFVLMRVVDDNLIFANALRSAAGGKIDGWYWSSTERNEEEAWNVNNSGRCSSEDKEEKIKVRAIRAFTIN